MLQGQGMEWQHCRDAGHAVSEAVESSVGISYWKLFLIAAVCYYLWEQLTIHAGRHVPGSALCCMLCGSPSKAGTA